MLALYHETVAPLKELQLLAGLPIAITREDKVVVLMPVDYVYWNRRSDQVFGTLGRQLSMTGYRQPELVLGGTLSRRARYGMEDHGFIFRESFLMDLTDG